MIKTNLTINLNEDSWLKDIPNIDELSNNVLISTLNYVQKNEEIDFLELNKAININLVLSNDEEIQELNKEFRNINKPTNVLSFALIDSDDFDDNIDIFNEIDLGDIIISYNTMKKEAKEKETSLSSHYTHLFIHGVLHLLGFDHQDDDEANYMENFEIEILKTLNINNPYE